MTKKYSEFAFAIDLIMQIYNETNPIIISEKIKEDLDMDITIHQVSDYLSIERNEDFESENRKQYYQNHY